MFFIHELCIKIRLFKVVDEPLTLKSAIKIVLITSKIVDVTFAISYTGR